MAEATPPTSQVLEVIVRSPGCNIEEIVFQCPNLTWNQVFTEIDRLSHEGYVVLSLQSRGRYAVSRPTRLRES